MASVGDIEVSINLDIRELQRNLERVEQNLGDLQREFRDTADEADRQSRNMAKAFGGLFAEFAGSQMLSGLTGVVGDILNVTSEAEALASQYTQVMGKMKGDSDKYIDEMSVAWGKHPDELKSAMMQYTAILKSKGMNDAEAYTTASAYLARTVDANAFANEAMSDTTARFMGMIKGEYDSLDTAMVNLSATMLDDTAQEQYGKKFDELNIHQQEALKMSEAYRQHVSAGVFGQGEREAESYTNKVANLAQTFEDLKVALGTPIIASAGDILGDLAGTLEKLAGWFGDLPKPVQAFTVVVSIMTVAAIGLALALGGVGIALWGIAGAIGASVGMVAAVVAGVVVGVALIAGIVYLVIKYWDEIKAWTIATWEKIAEATSKAWQSIKDKAVEIWTAIASWFSNTFEKLKTYFSETWTSVKDKTVEIFNSIVDFLIEWGLKLFNMTPIGMFVNFIIDNWEFISESTSLIFQMILDIIDAIWSKLVEIVSPYIAALVNFVTEKWTIIKTATTTAFNAVKDFVLEIWQKIVDFLQPIIQSIVSFITEKWTAIKNTTTEKFTQAKDAVADIFGKMWSKITEVAGNIWTTIKEKFTAAKEAITEPIEEAKETVSGLIEDIKGFFTDLKLKIPLPSVPKFSVVKGTSTFLGKEITVPKFDIKWNAKGAIFDKATVLGGGQGVGEKGGEIVMPVQHRRYLQPFSSSIAENLAKLQKETPDSGVVNQFNISQLVVREEADVDKIAERLEAIQRQQQRAKGTLAYR